MKFDARDDRQTLARMRRQRRYPSRQKTWKSNAAISRAMEKMHKGATMSSDFGSVEDLLNPIEDSYYVSTHRGGGADTSTETRTWAGLDGFGELQKPWVKVAIALVVLAVAVKWLPR